MPRVALVQDGTEVARQRYADVVDRFERCVANLSSTRGLDFGLRTFTDDAVRFLLSGITPDEFDCIVFASNAMLSDGVERAVSDHRDELAGYIRSGGGLLVLHQLRPSLEDFLPSDVCPSLVDRRTGEGVRSQTEVEDDVVLCYPWTVRPSALADGDEGPGPARLYWKAMRADSLPQKMQPILRADLRHQEILLARTASGVAERVVVTTIPLDWRDELDLLGNAIRYACLGEPRRFLWLPGSTANERTELFLRWLYRDRASAVSSMPDLDTMDEPDRWLLGHVEVCIVTPERFDAMRDHPSVEGFVEGGGTVITAEPVGALRASRVSALVGAYGQRVLSRRLYAELAANPAWISIDNAFHLRNIVAVLDLFADQGLDEAALAVRAADVRHLASSIERRLQEPEHREDLSSSIALGEVLCHLIPPPRGASPFDWMDALEPRPTDDVRLQIRALRSRWLARPDTEFLDAATRLLEDRGSPGDTQPSFAPVVRLMDAYTVLDDAGKVAGDEASFGRFAKALDGELSRRPPDPDVGWVSVEATADVTRGLVALMSKVPEDGPDALSLAGHVAAGSTVLRRAMRRFEEREASVAWLAQLARLIHALIVVDDRFPIGLQRLASLEWPDEGPARDLATAREDPLVADLAVQVKRLRVQEQRLYEQRLAAATGRVFATVAPVVLAVLAVVLPVWLSTPDSLWDWVAKVGVPLSFAATALGFVFGYLKPRGLLTTWGERALVLLVQASTVLKALASARPKQPEAAAEEERAAAGGVTSPSRSTEPAPTRRARRPGRDRRR